MKALLLEAPRRFRPVSLDEPGTPGPGEALVSSRRVGICGTDYAGYLGKAPFWKYPNIIGHELGVEVLETGPEVDHVQPGDRCAVEPYLNCGTCFACRNGASNCCERLEVLGIMTEGGLQERFRIRADKLHPSSRLEFEQLALVETLGIGAHAVERSAPRAGEPVLIIGAGPIGLSVLEFARLSGARITVLDRLEKRLAFCRETGAADHVVQAREETAVADQIAAITGGDRFPLVFDATGNPESMSRALRHVAQTGTLVYVGVTTSEIRFPHPELHRKEMTLLASRNSLPADFTRIIQLIEDGRINTSPWITNRVEFAKLPEVFPSLTRPETGTIKAIVEVATES